jgi:hypothetical protein
MPFSVLVIKAAFLVVIPVILHLTAFILLIFPIIPIPFVVLVVPAAFFAIIPIILLLEAFILVVIILFQNVCKQRYQKRR